MLRIFIRWACCASPSIARVAKATLAEANHFQTYGEFIYRDIYFILEFNSKIYLNYVNLCELIYVLICAEFIGLK